MRFVCQHSLKKESTILRKLWEKLIAALYLLPYSNKKVRLEPDTTLRYLITSDYVFHKTKMKNVVMKERELNKLMDIFINLHSLKLNRLFFVKK